MGDYTIQLRTKMPATLYLGGTEKQVRITQSDAKPYPVSVKITRDDNKVTDVTLYSSPMFVKGKSIVLEADDKLPRDKTLSITYAPLLSSSYDVFDWKVFSGKEIRIYEADRRTVLLHGPYEKDSSISADTPSGKTQELNHGSTMLLEAEWIAIKVTKSAPGQSQLTGKIEILPN